MSDLDHLDRAFEALTRELAHDHGPGAAAAMSTARRRRRTQVGAVALAALVVVGGGLTVPGLVSGGGGIASDGGAARLDTAALERATQGWTSDWETWEQYSPWGGGSFGAASCSSVGGPGTAPVPEPVSRGVSRFVTHSGSTATVVVQRYADAELATSSQELSHPAPDTCGTTTTYDVDGVRVRHDSMPADPDTSDDMWLGDIWSVRIGADTAAMEVVTDAGVADTAVAERVAETLVAGLRDGWTQSGREPVPPQPDSKGQLPEWPDVDLDGALGGWQAASRAASSTWPNTPCLEEMLTTGALATSAGGTPRGVTWAAAGFDDDATGQERVIEMVDQLRDCTEPEMTLDGLVNGVTLMTYDTGGPAGRGALWLSAVGDRAAVIGVDGADRPMPADVALDVARVLHLYLREPWE